MTKEEMLLECIRKRGHVGYPVISLKSLLSEYQMAGYYKLCFRRILTDNLIDKENITINPKDFDDLIIKPEGMEKCMHILKGYVDEADLQSYHESLINATKCMDIMQREAELLRQTPRWILVAASKGYDLEDLGADAMESIRSMAVEELKARRLSAKIKRNASKILALFKNMWHYRRLYLFALLHPNMFENT